MAFYDFPAMHWQRIRQRTKRSKGCLSRDGMLYMMFKLGMCAEGNRCRLRQFDYLAKVIAETKEAKNLSVTKRIYSTSMRFR